MAMVTVWEKYVEYLRWLFLLPCRKPLLLVLMLVLFVTWMLSLSDNSVYQHIQVGDGAKDLEMLGKSISRNGQSDIHLDIINVSKPYRPDFKCIYMKTSPPTPVCLHAIYTDEYISHDLETTGLWEPRVLGDFIEVLDRDPTIGVVDLGANIGVYTLVSAKMGHKVIAVEPYLENIYRIHYGALLGKSDRNIVLLHNAVSDRRVMSTLKMHGTNQGDIRVRHGSEPCMGSCPAVVATVLLDDLLQVATFNRCVIKIDVQGFEHRIMMRASTFLQEITVPYIFMEWQLMRDHYVASNHTSLDKQLVKTMVEYLMHKRYRPYTLDVSGAYALDPARWHEWPDDIIWRRLASDRELSKLLRNHFLVWP